jgi:hypothetical protein
MHKHGDAMPRCWDSLSDWEDWIRLARSSGRNATLKRHGYCLDCAPAFKARMQACNRCAHPDVYFVEVALEEGCMELQGRRPTHKHRFGEANAQGLFERQCVECNKPFTTQSPNGRYCGPACFFGARRKRRCELRSRAVKPVPELLGMCANVTR